MPLTTILVATDFGDAAAAAVGYALMLAEGFGARVHILHVTDDLGARVLGPSPLPIDLGQQQDEIDAAARRQLQTVIGSDPRAGSATSAIVTSGHPAVAILDYAQRAQADLIVMGTHGRAGLAEFFMGSVAQQIVRRANCPVVTLRRSPGALSGASTPSGASA
jgi:nucleotide-binding universal stress UspA family protein